MGEEAGYEEVLQVDTDSVAVGMPGDKRRASVYSIDEDSNSVEDVSIARSPQVVA